MHAYEDVVPFADLAHHERNVRHLIDFAFVREADEIPVRRRKSELRDALDELLVPHAVRDEIFDRHEFEIVFFCEFAQVVQAHHRAVVVHDLANDACRFETGKPREIDRGFGLTRAHEHAAVARAQRKGMTGA